ncbi:MAG: hypothetical protein Tsb009_25580 [Planctomycetaceae bacterium]
MGTRKGRRLRKKAGTAVYPENRKGNFIRVSVSNLDGICEQMSVKTQPAFVIFPQKIVTIKAFNSTDKTFTSRTL